MGMAPRVLTGPVEVHHQAMLHVLLDQLQRPLEDLPGPGLLHRVGVPRIPEQGQQVVRGARAAGGRAGRGGKSGQTTENKSHSRITEVTCFYGYISTDMKHRTLLIPWKATKQRNKTKRC